MTILAPEASVQIRSDRRRFLPCGPAGGGQGTPSLNLTADGAIDHPATAGLRRGR